jgi:4-methyl-5(b-hydroxyethyl)-thiazole monophosphate biosynthesis
MTDTHRPKVLVPIADGTEEIEAVCIIDVLRRAGADVTVASVGDLQITASRGVRIVADSRIEDCREERFDLIALPGGIPGAEHLRESQTLVQLLKQHQASGGLYGAICAAPAIVLSHHGLLGGRRATGHPAFTEQLTDGEATASRVVVDGKCVTSQGPGTALEFALTLVALLLGEEKAQEVAAPMLVAGSTGSNRSN